VEEKLGVFICTGYGISEALDVEALQKVATVEYKAAVCERIASTAAKDLQALRATVAQQQLTHLVLAGPSSRQYTAGDLPGGMAVEIVNLLEWVVMTHPAGDEDTQMMAEDYLRMGIVRARKTNPIKPFDGHGALCKTIMVVGGGIAGLTAAREAADAGYQVLLVEKEKELGGYMKKLQRSIPTRPPYRELEETGIADLVAAVVAHPNITVYTGTTIASTVGAPGLFKVTLEGDGSGSGPLDVGTFVQATGFRPAEPTNFEYLGYGKISNVVTNHQLEEMAANGGIKRPSDGAPAKNVAFVQCGDSRNPETFSYASAIMSLNALKQALYVREQGDDAKAYIFFEHLRTPGQHEDFYRRVQEDPGVFLTRGSVDSVTENGGRLTLQVKDTMIAEQISVEVDLLVLNSGMVPVSADGEAIRKLEDSKAIVAKGPEDAKYDDSVKRVAELASHEGTAILNLKYRQGPDMPALTHGYPDSHFICFPYETRRTGVYAAGTVRSPMSGNSAAEDGMGAALKAIQAVEMLSRGETVHPRAGDVSYPVFSLERCTQCKRCTEECPFGAINEDAKGTPEYNVTRCRRCGICLGACPERIINFPDYAVVPVAEMVKAVEVPDESEEKPRVLVLACENDAIPALERAAQHGLQYSSFIRVIPVRCLGSCNVVWIKEAISMGFDGVLLLGCKWGDNYQCHFIKGSELMNTRGDNIKETLQQMSMENERVQLHQIEITDYQKVVQVIGEFMETIEEVGMNPFKGM
jgi:quinone-modifying oxidoreductase subunit QmoB